MARAVNPNRDPVESMVTRTVTIATYEVSYLPNGEKEVQTVCETVFNNDQIARRDLRRKYREMGIIIDIALTESHTELLGATIEDFLKIAKPIKRAEKKSTEVVNND